MAGERPSARRSRAPTVLVILFLSSAAALAETAPSSGCARGSAVKGSCGLAGRLLSEALDDLRARGLNVVYSSDLVRPDMVVGTEPSALDPRLVLDRLLSPFGLEARDGPGGTILIIRKETEPAAGGAGA